MTINPGFAPKETFDEILKWAVIPTFDMVIQYGDQGIIFVIRTIAPYKNQWALPGLRMLKGESIDDTLKRIAWQEVGLRIIPKNKILLGQFVGKFKTENSRQDLSTGYLVKVEDSKAIKINEGHFSAYQVTKKIPEGAGAMYRYYAQQWHKIIK